MSLSDQVACGPAPTMHGLPCSVGELFRTLPAGGEVEALNKMLYVLGWSATQIFDALRAEGYAVARQSINKHRRRACRCFSTGSAAE